MGPFSAGRNALESGAGYGLARESILDDSQVDPFLARLRAKIGHLRHGQATVLGAHHGQGFRRDRVDFCHHDFLLF